MEFVTVYTALNQAEAHLVRARLEVAEFHPFVINELEALAAQTVGGIRVQVPTAEGADALELLRTPADPAE